MGYKFCEKPDDITFDEIAETINVSFMDAVEKGIRFGIEKISGTELKKLLDDQNGKVFVALDNHQVVGTLSVVHKKTAAWYYKGDAMRFRLVAVLPEKAGQAGHSPLLSIFHITLLLLGVLFIVLGVMNGGMRDVLVKAIQICTECSGLG